MVDIACSAHAMIGGVTEGLQQIQIHLTPLNGKSADQSNFIVHAPDIKFTIAEIFFPEVL